jgi:hypothetical protein
MAQGRREAAVGRPAIAWRSVGRCIAATLAGVLLLAAAPAVASGPGSLPARPAAELIPEGARLFLEIELNTLRQKGPDEAVRHGLSLLAPLASGAGLNIDRLRTVIMANSDEPMSGDRLPSWLLFVQDGAAPALSSLESTFRPYAHTALKAGTMSGLPYRGNRELSLVALPGYAALVAGAAGPRAIIDAWQGRGGTPLIRSPRAELLQKASGTTGAGASAADRPAAAAGSTALRLWLSLTAAMQRGLVEDAHLPAVPSEIAMALRMLPEHAAELSMLARCSDEEASKRLAGWLGARVSSLASTGEIQMLGLATYVKAAKIVCDGAIVELDLPLSGDELGGLIERAIAVAGGLVPRAKPAGIRHAP